MNTEHWLPTYYESPAEFGSLAQFKCLCMMTVVQKHLGAKYNSAFSEGTYDPRDSRDLFIHGLLTGHGGACVSMPTLLCAIGRRLGYPLYLAHAKEHIFVRWDDPATGERFNFDGTSRGFTARDDEYYRQHPVPLSPEDTARFPRYLNNLATRGEELALMLGERAQCLMFNLRPLEALISYQYAMVADPGNRLLEENRMIAIVAHEAFDAAYKAARSRGATQYPLSRVYISRTKDPRKRVVCRAAAQLLARIQELYPPDHPVRIA